jgi:hypothetical protein
MEGAHQARKMKQQREVGAHASIAVSLAHGIVRIDNWLWEVKDMATTVEELEKRMMHIEQELARLCRLLEKPRAETPAERGARLLREAQASQVAVNAAVVKAFEKMGITEEPVSAETLRAMMAECGVKAEENAFSRAIIAMREE